MKPTTPSSTQVLTLRGTFVPISLRGDRRPPAPPSLSFLNGGSRGRRGPMSKQEVADMIEEALRITSDNTFEDEDDESIPPFQHHRH